MTGESKPESWSFSSSAIAMESKRGEASKGRCDDSKGTVEQSGKKGLANEKLFDSD